MCMRIAEPPSWEFEVSGRLIDASEAEGSSAAASTSAAQAPGSAGQAVAAAGKTPSPPLTSLLRRLTVRLDAEQYPAANVIVWSRNAHEGPPRDRFSVRCAPRCSQALPAVNVPCCPA